MKTTLKQIIRDCDYAKCCADTARLVSKTIRDDERRKAEKKSALRKAISKQRGRWSRFKKNAEERYGKDIGRTTIARCEGALEVLRALEDDLL